MSNDDATRTRPDRFSGRDHGRLRWGQRRGCDSATSGHHDVRERGRRRGRPGRLLTENRRLRSMCSGTTDPTVGRALDSRPALASLRAAAQNRRSRGIRVRMLENRREILSLRLDPSYARATAIVLDRQRVQPRGATGALSGRDAERARALRTPTVGPERSVRRLEGRAPAVGTRSFVLVAIAVVVLVFAAPAPADSGSPPPIQIGISSQQAGRSRDGASSYFRDTEPGRTGQSPTRPVTRVRLPIEGGAVDDLPDHDPYPPPSQRTRSCSDSQPFGPGSFWYPVGPGRVCIYAPNSVLPCYTLVVPAALPVVRRSIPRRSPPRSRSG